MEKAMGKSQGVSAYTVSAPHGRTLLQYVDRHNLYNNAAAAASAAAAAAVYNRTVLTGERLLI